jgi:GTP pyrophosphokinase
MQAGLSDRRRLPLAVLGTLTVVGLGPTFDDALVYAVNLHRTQVRKGSEVPYASHLLGVASLVIEEGGTETQAIAALLHDAVEDQGGLPRLDEIHDRYGDDVARIVLACTDSTEEPKPPWRERKEAYLRHLTVAPAPVLRVSLADKLHNARSIVVDRAIVGETVWDRFNAPRGEQAWYYERLLATFLERLPASRNLPELARVVGELFPPR